MKYITKVCCEKCGKEDFKLALEEESQNALDSYVTYKTMCHRGFGWDLNGFKLVCSHCGGGIKIQTVQSPQKESK